MKKHLLPFAFLLFLTTQMKGQTSVYHPFPDSNAYWNEKFASYNSGGYGEEVYSLFIKGDTLINNKLYHKLYRNGYEDGVGINTSYYFNVLNALIRQDTLNRKIYVLQNATDMLLYDFNLSIGDTLPVTYHNQNGFRIVNNIDSILIGADYRKRFRLNNAAILIEGIGSTYGLIASLDYPFEIWYELHCFTQNNQTLYWDSISTHNCDFFTTMLKELSIEEFLNISPNPATNQLTIHASSLHAKAVTVSIMNVLGQETSPPAPLHIERGDATIDIGELPAGMYFLQLKTESGSVVKRFVKE